jgi:hypothetical protein
MEAVRSSWRGDERPELCPTATAYFDALPHGWASFPDCVARASLLESLGARGALDALDDSLPTRLQPLRAHLATGSEWLPEVVHVAALLSVRDVRFGRAPGADDEFLDWMAQLNRELLASPDQAGARRAACPADLVPQLPALWATFHQGTTTTTTTTDDSHARVVLAHPRRLFHALSLESHRRAVVQMLARAGAAQLIAEARTELSGEQAETVLELSWS